jgi:hypothetical protein
LWYHASRDDFAGALAQERALHPALAKTGIGVDVAGVRVMESMGAGDMRLDARG